MIKLTIIDIKEYTYIFSNNNKIYEVNIEFLDEKKPKINDIIYINSKIIEKKNIYTYGPLNSKYSKNINTNEEELLKIVSENEEYYLQRYYG